MKKKLQQFILSNIQRFYECHDRHYSSLVKEKEDIRDFIEGYSLLLDKLDYSSSEMKGFISLLFDFCERFGLICVRNIESVLSRHELYIGKRREAAKLYLLGVRDNQQYLERFENIINLLQCAFETEEEDEKKGIVTFVNFYAKVIQDVENDSFVEGSRNLITENTEAILFFPMI